MILSSYELTGKPLDWALAKAMNVEDAYGWNAGAGEKVLIPWATDPGLSRAVLQERKVSVMWRPNLKLWWACVDADPEDDFTLGATSADRHEAQMRALVAHSLGNSVDVPDDVATS